jgi:hypothetical protein
MVVLAVDKDVISEDKRDTAVLFCLSIVVVEGNSRSVDSPSTSILERGNEFDDVVEGEGDDTF